MKIMIADRHIKTFPLKGSIYTESFAYKPPNFDTDPNDYHREHFEDLNEEAIEDVTDALPDHYEWNEYAKETGISLKDGILPSCRRVAELGLTMFYVGDAAGRMGAQSTSRIKDHGDTDR